MTLPPNTESCSAEGVRGRKIIDAYAATAGDTRRMTAAMHRNQSGDPGKLAHALLTLAGAEHPPRRFVAGADAVDIFEEELTRRNAELNAWRNLSLALAHEDSLEVSHAL